MCRSAAPGLRCRRHLAGDIQILFDNLYPTLPQTQDGKLTALCVTTPERSPAAPDIPTMREGAPELSKFDVSSWFGIFLPKAAPAPAVEALNKEIKAMLAREDIKTTIGKMGATRRLGHAAAILRFRAGGDGEIRRDHQARRPADGRELIA